MLVNMIAAVALSASPAVAASHSSPFQQIIDRQRAAWANADGAAYAAEFTDDGDMITFSGALLHTKARIAKDMQYYFDNYTKGSRLKFEGVQTARRLGAGTVVWITKGCPIRKGATDCTLDSKSIQTYVFQRERGQWKIASFQNTRIMVDQP
jgi:uncharacterized protein (TIGR02246 family)